MLTFKYVARDTATGQKIKSEVQADSEQAAAKRIRQEGLAPISITAASVSTNGVARYFNRVRAKDKVLFSRQLSTLINAGLPLVQSLRSVASQTQNKKLKVIIGQVINDVEAGLTLSVALSRHPDEFNQIFISLIAAGEVSGTLDASLERLAMQQEKDAEIASKVRGAMIYPVIVLLVMIGVVAFMIIKVLPEVENLYEGIGSSATLPLLTRVLLVVSNFTIKYWWIVLIVLGLMTFFTTRWARTLGGKSVIDRLKMRMWPIGRLFMKVYMARFARTGTTLVASGVPLIQMLDITGNSVNNVHVQASIKRATEKVKGGKALSDSLQNDPNFLELVPSMIHIGEQSGSLESMLGRVADYYEKEVDDEIKAISTIIEPVLMVVLGVVALLLVAAILLPIYGLVNQTNII